MQKELLGLIAIILTFYAFIPYIRSIMQGKTKPHVFSWVIWASTTFIVFLAQLADNGGAGAWPIGVSGVITFYVAYLAWQKKGDSSITRSDWVFFITAMSSIPLWYITSNPLWAVIILTIVDVLGFAPTFRKSYSKPFEERLDMYVVSAVRNAISIAALENYSTTTIFFPAVSGGACAVFIAMVIWRRRVEK